MRRYDACRRTGSDPELHSLVETTSPSRRAGSLGLPHGPSSSSHSAELDKLLHAPRSRRRCPGPCCCSGSSSSACYTSKSTRSRTLADCGAASNQHHWAHEGTAEGATNTERGGNALEPILLLRVGLHVFVQENASTVACERMDIPCPLNSFSASGPSGRKEGAHARPARTCW